MIIPLIEFIFWYRTRLSIERSGTAAHLSGFWGAFLDGAVAPWTGRERIVAEEDTEEGMDGRYSRHLVREGTSRWPRHCTKALDENLGRCHSLPRRQSVS